jgi:hypothetical protein
MFMKRTKAMKKWIKRGGGSFSIRRGKRSKLVKPNEVFFATEEEVPQAFRDSVVLADDKQPEPISEKKDVAVHDYTKRERSNGWWDVADSNGKVVNEKAMREEDTDQLIQSLKQAKSHE